MPGPCGTLERGPPGPHHESWVDLEVRAPACLVARIRHAIRPDTSRTGRQDLAAKAARRPPARKPVLVLNGPNLNMLGKRQPEIYGRETLADVEKACRDEADRLGIKIEFFQSNHEGALVDRIQAAREANAGIVINA